MELQNSPNKLSRRNWLRDAAIATTGAALMPSLLTSCSDHRIPPGVGVGDPGVSEPTLEELIKATNNLANMNKWIQEVYNLNKLYEDYVHNTLLSGSTATNLGTFVVDVFAAIAIGVVTAAADVETAGLASAVFAVAGASINKFAFGSDIPADLQGVIADFEEAQLDMLAAITGELEHLSDPKPNNTYKNLKDAFKGGAIEFNNKPYTLRDLVNADFPSTGDEYFAMREAARNKFKEYIWNVVIMRAAKMYQSYGVAISSNIGLQIIDYARNFYKTNPAVYLRGGADCYPCYYRFYYFYFTIDGRELSPAAAKELFKDDTRGNIINPDALFTRDYVFKQFQRERPDFLGTLDLRTDAPQNDDDPYKNFDPSTLKYEFTGGELFPVLIKK